MRTPKTYILATSFLLWTTILAVPLSGPKAGLIQLPGRNLTLPFNVVEASHDRPPDPYDYRARGSRQTVRFSNYGPNLASVGIEECIALAIFDLTARSGRVYEYKDDLEYSAYGVVLKMVPGQAITWTMWGEAIFGILKFSRAEFAGVLRFEIMQDGIAGWIGKGSIEVGGVGEG